MNALREAASELAGLFVEDGAFALGIAIWLALVLGLATAAVIPAAPRGYLLFAGLAVVLVTSVVRSARARP